MVMRQVRHATLPQYLLPAASSPVGALRRAPYSSSLFASSPLSSSASVVCVLPSGPSCSAFLCMLFACRCAFAVDCALLRVTGG